MKSTRRRSASPRHALALLLIQRALSRHSVWALLLGTSLVAGCAGNPESREADATKGAQAAPVAQPSPADRAGQASASADNSPVDFRVLGAADAPVMMIEFTDLQCPYCARFALQTWPALRERYIDTGKVRFATRDLPLPFHPYAVPAAIAARCAGAQGKFWEYREALFHAQPSLASEPYEALARRFGLDLTQFAACRADAATVAAVRADASIAAANGVGATPTFAIGRLVEGRFRGEIINGAQPFEVFEQRIEALLKEAGASQ